jgi:uncharacterized protein YegL
MARAPGVADALGRRPRVSTRSVGGRVPLLLVLDRSKSIRRDGRQEELNTELRQWLRELREDAALSNVDLALITFGGAGEVEVLSLRDRAPGGFTPVADAVLPAIECDGSTPLGPAIERAIELCRAHVAALRGAGRGVYCPNVWIVTDGEPTDVRGHATDDWHGAVRRLRAAEVDRRLLVFAAGLRGADRSVLAEVAPESHYMSADISIARALKLVSISSREATNHAGATPSEIYARVRTLLGVDEHGELA